MQKAQVQRENVYWARLDIANWELWLGATAQGLCSVGWQDWEYQTFASEIASRIPLANLIEDRQRLEPYAQELREYFVGQRKQFSFPLDLRGTPFQVAVWKGLASIPYGETRSYSEMALLVDKPRAVRAVGTANGANPIPVVLPCHRVIGKDGALRGFGGGLNLKEELLKIEGVAR